MDADQLELDTNTLFVMWIDEFDRITGLKSNTAHGVSDLLLSNSKNSFIGTNLFDYVLGHFTRQFLRKFLRAARETSEQRRLVYRCDSPTHKQLMEMRASSTGDGEIRISHSLVESEALEFEVHFNSAARSQNSRMLRCSICNRLRHRGTNDWREAVSIVEPGTAIMVIHTVCPDCRSGLKVKSLFCDKNR